MFSFLRKKSLFKRAVRRTTLAGAVPVLLIGLLFVSCEQPAGVERFGPDADATLKSLVVDAGTLSPAFRASNLEYNVLVRDTVDSVTVTATPNSNKAVVSGVGTKTLSEDNTTVTVGVKAENGDSKTYTITVKRLDSSVIGIENAQDMAKIGVEEKWTLASSYVLMNDITLTNWKPIGATATPFTGKFNGNGKTITLNGFDSAALSGNTNLGIFAAVKGASSSDKAEIKNLKIQAALPAGTKTTTGNRIGLVAGTVQDAVIEDITLSGTFNIESSILVNLGGIAGTITGAGTVVKDSKSTMNMYIIPGSGGGGSYSYIGGFVGQYSGGGGVENCHYNGNITADNISSSAGAGQVFAGGIANSVYDMKTTYIGYIQDCSFIGTLLAKCGSMWTFAGGIAATNVGGTVNDYSQTSRIVRCYVEGTVSVEGTTAGNPYVGGVVGYNYYGALVSQCYFNGTVIAAKTGDYTGGIAGYNSQTGAPNNSRIEDCWSAGEVKGFNNAGGIVGQNQVNTYIRRCYSTAAISVTNQAGTGIGGIAGMNASTQADAITACVALNKSLTAPKGNNINRVTGTTGGNRSNNHAWTNMPINAGTGTYTERKGDTLADGVDCAEKPVQSFYSGLGWDFSNVWKMGTDYPKLKWQP